MTSTQNWKSDLQGFLKGRGKIQQLAELTGVEHLRATAAENRRNSEAEAAHARRVVWGSDESGGGSSSSSAEDDMGTTILGDITQPPTVIVPAQQNNLWPMVALALAGMLPAAGLGAAGAGAAAAYLLSRPAAVPEVRPDPDYEDSSVKIGLGRLEDYTK